MSSSETLSVVRPHIPPPLYPSVFSGSPFILPQGGQKVFGCIWPLAGCRRREDRAWLSSNIIQTDTVATLTVYLCLICVTLNMWWWRKTWVTVEPHNHELRFRQVRPSLRSSCGHFINLHQKKRTFAKKPSTVAALHIMHAMLHLQPNTASKSVCFPFV